MRTRIIDGVRGRDDEPYGPKRFWAYPRGHVEWAHLWSIAKLGGDEFGNRPLVLRLPFGTLCLNLKPWRLSRVDPWSAA